jgi:hypothetical protein
VEGFRSHLLPQAQNPWNVPNLQHHPSFGSTALPPPLLTPLTDACSRRQDQEHIFRSFHTPSSNYAQMLPNLMHIPSTQSQWQKNTPMLPPIVCITNSLPSASQQPSMVGDRWFVDESLPLSALGFSPTYSPGIPGSIPSNRTQTIVPSAACSQAPILAPILSSMPSQPTNLGQSTVLSSLQFLPPNFFPRNPRDL